MEKVFAQLLKNYSLPYAKELKSLSTIVILSERSIKRRILSST